MDQNGKPIYATVAFEKMVTDYKLHPDDLEIELVDEETIELMQRSNRSLLDNVPGYKEREDTWKKKYDKGGIAKPPPPKNPLPAIYEDNANYGNAADDRRKELQNEHSRATLMPDDGYGGMGDEEFPDLDAVWGGENQGSGV